MITFNNKHINSNENLNNKSDFYNQKKNNIPSFKADFSGVTKMADIFIKSQENLANIRFVQDTATNWAPKAIFSRSKEDFAEMSFLEFLESAIFYYSAPIIGGKLFRNKIFNHIGKKDTAKKVNEQIPQTIEEIIKNKTLTKEVKRSAISKKAGIILACTAVPVAEYDLSFAKNLFTLKTFNKSNFNNITNLNKKGEETEDKEQQKKVEASAKNQFKKGALLSAAGIIAGTGLAVSGHKYDALQTLSKAVIQPGKAIASLLKKLGIKNKKVEDTISQFHLDFKKGDDGELKLGKGQLGLTAVVGLFGYSKAAEDRGKLDVMEVWTRVPLVVFYTIVGSELFQSAFEKFLEKNNKYSDLLRKKDGKLYTPERKELPKIAEKIAKERGTDKAKELARLTKEKAIVHGVPFFFSIAFMGLTLSAITRFWTQYRYNHQQELNCSKKNYDKMVLQ